MERFCVRFSVRFSVRFGIEFSPPSALTGAIAGDSKHRFQILFVGLISNKSTRPLRGLKLTQRILMELVALLAV
jgi:hypothetical protein